MKTEQKARAMYDAALDCATQYDREDNAKMGELVRKSICTLPEDSAARLFDIMTRKASAR